MLELVLMLLGVLGVDEPNLNGGARPPRVSDTSEEPDMHGLPTPPR